MTEESAHHDLVEEEKEEMKERSGAFSRVGNLRFIRPPTQTHTHTEGDTPLNKEGLWVGGEGLEELLTPAWSHTAVRTQ